uniref:FHA domain-containing protein n=1 Tax=Schlesneria paludicola TaxID=360056 RepID=A0A7C4QP79_9PLAN
MRAQLVPLKGGHPIPILRDVTLVGRQKDLCDIVLDRNSISKLHCVLVRTDGLLFLRDLGSTNGTKVNGQRVVRGALLPGDELAFASEKFRVEMGPDVAEPPSDVHTAQTEEIVAPPGLLGGFQQQLRADVRSGHDSQSDVRPLDEGDPLGTGSV